MKLSGHEINSQLRQKLEMPTGRHLYVILGTYDRLERYERVDFREARSPSGQKLGDPEVIETVTGVGYRMVDNRKHGD